MIINSPSMSMNAVIMSTAFIDAGRSPLRAEARVLRNGRSLIFVEGEVRNADGTLVAKALISTRGVERVSFLPAILDKQMRPEILRNGDPRFDDSGPDGLMIRRACQYASAILKKRRMLPDDASAYRATWAPEQRAVPAV